MKCADCRGRGKVDVRCFGWNGSEYHDKTCEACKGTGECEQKYAYTFSLWPDENGTFHEGLFDVFRLLQTRVEMAFTEEGFRDFRAKMNLDGFTLRAVVRVPQIEPEEVA
jgi:hypothetical protein